MDFSNTGIDSTAAASIIPGLRRLGGSRFVIPGVDVFELDLSHNMLTNIDPAWFEAWDHEDFPQYPPALHILDLSYNELTEAIPETFVPLAEYLETLHLIGNPLDPDAGGAGVFRRPARAEAANLHDARAAVYKTRSRGREARRQSGKGASHRSEHWRNNHQIRRASQARCQHLRQAGHPRQRTR